MHIVGGIRNGDEPQVSSRNAGVGANKENGGKITWKEILYKN